MFGIREDELPELGVFSTDSPIRPNPIAITVVKLIKRIKKITYTLRSAIYIMELQY